MMLALEGWRLLSERESHSVRGRMFPSDTIASGLPEPVIDQLPVGVALFDREMRLQRWNSIWADFFSRYTPGPASALEPGVRLFALLPDADSIHGPMIQRVLAGETVHYDALPAEGDTENSYWDVVFAPLMEAGRVVGLIETVVDATERMRSYQGLEQRVAERTHELATLLDVAHHMASTLELEPLLGMILDQLRAVVPYDGASVFTLSAGVLSLVAYRGPIALAEAMTYSFPLDTATANRRVIEQRSPLLIPDVRGDTPLARDFQATAGDALLTTFGYVRSWMGVPLLHKERVIGMLSLDHGHPDYYRARHARLAVAFAGHVAMAMGNARIYQAEQERREEAERRRTVAEGLREIVNVLNSNRPLDEILAYIVAQAGRLLGTDAAAIYRLDPATDRLLIQASQGMPDAYVRDMQIPLGQGAVGMAVLQRRPVVANDVPSILVSGLMDNPVQREHLSWLAEHYRSIVAVPLVIRDEIYGGIVLYFPEVRALAPEEVELAVSFGDQAALAIENARLREQAQQAAVAAERSRLARDLHDAVTQTLFSASLIADVLPRIWERNQEEGWRRLDELRQLTRGALAEMRALLLELRPSALTEANLSDLLRQLGEAVTGRARVPVNVIVEGRRAGQLSPDVQIAFYRIAQEALNNIAKHAGAGHAWVLLRFEGQTIDLSIRDDGQGFAVAEIPPDHLGLGIMRERAEAIGASLDIASEFGRGTQITVRWPR